MVCLNFSTVMTEYCISCLTELGVLDEDPNGDKNCICAKCRSEEDHDFDRFPNTKFDRSGRTIDS